MVTIMRGRRTPFWVGAGLVVVVVALFSRSGGIAVSRIDVTRTGWDTLAVEASFVKQSIIFVRRDVVPRVVSVTVYSAGFDELYVGDGRRIVVQDQVLGDLERLLIEVCAHYDGEEVCGQEAVLASPKRMRVAHRISYPDSTDVARGRYSLRFVYERQRWEGETWERIPHRGRLYSRMRVYVPGYDEDAVELAINGASGPFNLRKAPGFNDFHYRLATAMQDTVRIAVQFDIYAGYKPEATRRVASIAHSVEGVSGEARWREVIRLSELAAATLVAALTPGGEVEVQLPDTMRWDYNRLTNTYRMALILRWRGARSSRIRHYLMGTLRVDATDHHARFTLMRATGATARLWNRRIGESTLDLPSVQSYGPAGEQEQLLRSRSNLSRRGRATGSGRAGASARVQVSRSAGQE